MSVRVKIFFTDERNAEPLPCSVKRLIRRAVKQTLLYEGVRGRTQVSVTFTDDEGIRVLNRQFRKIDRATDVLSFPLYDFAKEELAFDADECVALGDIVISIERAKEQAKEIGHSFLEETAFLAVHSMLHLLGYDHERSEEDDEAQCSAQREIVETLDI